MSRTLKGQRQVSIDWLFVSLHKMIILQVGPALAARFAPDDLRGRYMVFFGLAWMVPLIFGPPAAERILDNYHPRWVWYLGGIILAVAV